MTSEGRVLVVFHRYGTGRRWLHRQYQHVFVAVRADGHWITFDGRAGDPEMAIAASSEFDLAAFYRARGFAVVEAIRRRNRTRWPWMAATCVGATKRILGLNRPWILTPYQLLKYLTR